MRCCRSLPRRSAGSSWASSAIYTDEEPTMEQTELDNLVVDNREDGLFRVHRSVFTDPQIMALEQRRVFEQCWLYAGHTSEIPQPGDFRSRRVAGRPVVLVRGSDGMVRVLL